MNDFKKLTLDDLVEITGETDAWFAKHFVKDDEGYYKRVPLSPTE